jgi:predicted transcriptional regulator
MQKTKTTLKFLNQNYEERIQKQNFLTKKETAILLHLFKNNNEKGLYITNIMRKANTTFSYVSKLMHYWEKQGIVKRIQTKNRKSKFFKLSEKGQKIAKLLNEVYQNF